MANPRKTATTTAMTTLLEAVARETREAALARWSAPPDVFVWRARRCAEAVLYWVLAREGANVAELAKQRKGLDQLFEHKQLEGVFSRETRAQLTTLREFGNIAAHYQLEGGVSAESADGVARHLAGLLREFYALDGGAVPEAQGAYLAALTDASSRILSPSERDAALARRERDEALQALSVERATRGAPLASSAPPARGRWLSVLAATIMVVIGVAAGRGTAHLPSGPTTAHLAVTPVATPLPPPTPVTLDRHAPPAPPPVAPVAPPLAPVAPPRTDATAMPRCDPGMLLVSGAAPFCIDRAPVLMGSYRACVERGECTRPAYGAGCNWQNAANDLAANCVTYEQALVYCQRRHPGRGALPTRAEWSLVTVGARGALLLPETIEWATDGPGGAALVRGPWRSRGFAWETPHTMQGRRELSFRCVVR